MTQIKDLTELTIYDPSYYAPIQKSDGTTRAILLANIVGGLSAWQLKTGNYTAVAGDRLRVDATAGDVVINLPSAPTASGADIWIQRLDTSANKVLLRSGASRINGQAGQDGVFAPAVIQLIERVSYVNSTIGWLGQYDRLTYQAAPVVGVSDPLFANVGLLLHLDTSFVDSSSFVQAVAVNGSLATSALQSQWGGGSAYFDGTGDFLTLGNDAIFNRAAGAFCWEFWVRIDSGASTVERNILKAPSGSNGLSISNTRRLIWWVDGTGNIIPGTPAQLAEETWHYIAVSRTGTTTTIWVNNAVYATITNSASYDFRTWRIGRGGFNSDWKGFMDDIRFTNVNRVITSAPTDAFPNS